MWQCIGLRLRHCRGRAGNAHLTGYSSSINVRVTHGAFQTTFGGVQDAFVTRIALRITFASLIRLVKQFDTNHDVAAIMVATLKWAQAAEREHDVKLADALLDVSIDEVLEQSGKSLTAAPPPPSFTTPRH